MRSFPRPWNLLPILAATVFAVGGPPAARADDVPGEVGDSVGIEPTPKARALAGEVIAKANAAYDRPFASGSPGFDAHYAVKRAGQPAGRLRVRAVAGAARAEVTYEGALGEAERAVVANHGAGLAGPLCGPFLVTEEAYGHPIFAMRLEDGYLLDLSGRGRIPGVRSSTCEVALDFSRTRELGHLTNGATVVVVRQGEAAGDRRYLTSQSYVLRRPGLPGETIEYAWGWKRTQGRMFVTRFAVTQTLGSDSLGWEMSLEHVTFGDAAPDVPVPLATPRPVPRPPPAPDRAPGPSAPPPMRKVVSNAANFVLYVPADWTVDEGATAQLWWVVAADPASGSGAMTAHGISPVGNDLRALAARFLGARLPRGTDLTIDEARMDVAAGRLYVRGGITGAPHGPQEYRAWCSVRDGSFTWFRVQAPRGEYEQRKQLLLSLLGNVGSLRNVFGAVPAEPLRTRTHALPQNAATFELPLGWRVTPLGSIYFLAQDPQAKDSFMVAVAEAITPEMRVRPPGVAVSPVRTASDGLRFFGEASRLMTNMRFTSVTPKPQLAATFAQGYTAGPVTAEEFEYTYDDANGRRRRGYTLGLVLGSRLGINWKLIHVTVSAPPEDFGVLAATFVRMGASYKVDDAYAERYVREGMERVRQMIQETAAIVARNAAEIRTMMNQAYQERMDSQSYIDFLRTGYIRGEASWVSGAEGGTIYKSDAWGIENTTTGDRWDGKPFNYYNFTGGGGYGGLQEIDRRDLYDRYVRGR